MLEFGGYSKGLSPMSNHRKRVNYSGEEQVAILRAHFDKLKNRLESMEQCQRLQPI